MDLPRLRVDPQACPGRAPRGRSRPGSAVLRSRQPDARRAHEAGAHRQSVAHLGEGIILPRALRADSARLDLRRVHASAPLLTRDAARTRARKGNRRIGLAALAGAGRNTRGRHRFQLVLQRGRGSCVLFGFGTLGGMPGAALGALGGKSGASNPTPRRRTPRAIGSDGDGVRRVLRSSNGVAVAAGRGISELSAVPRTGVDQKRPPPSSLVFR